MKNAIYLTLIFVFGALNINAQEDNNIEFSLNYSIGESFRNLTAEDSRYLTFEESDAPTITQGIELQVRLKLNEKFGFSTGIGYQQYGDKTNLNIASMEIDPSGNFIYSIEDTGRETTTKYRYDFISVPLLVDYKVLNKGKNQMDIMLGGNVNYFLQAKKITTYSGSESNNGTMQSYSFSNKKIAFSGQAALFYKRSINDNSFIKIGPKFDYFFNSISKGSSCKLFPIQNFIGFGFWVLNPPALSNFLGQKKQLK